MSEPINKEIAPEKAASYLDKLIEALIRKSPETTEIAIRNLGKDLSNPTIAELMRGLRAKAQILDPSGNEVAYAALTSFDYGFDPKGLPNDKNKWPLDVRERWAKVEEKDVKGLTIHHLEKLLKTTREYVEEPM